MMVGVVGKANVGKSTFFKAATLAEVEIANYPFATIDPNVGVAYVKVECAEKFFSVKCHPREGFCLNGIRFVPVKLLDVAGLVPGAHEGKGMGNQFLNDLSQADVLVHVVDAAGSSNSMGEPITPGTYDPADDIKFLEEELDYWYLGIMNKGWEKFARQLQQTHEAIPKPLAKQLSAFRVTEELVEEGMEKLKLSDKPITTWSNDDLFLLAQFLRKRTKPMIIALNKVDLKSGQENVARLQKEFPHLIMVPVSGDCELALREAAKHGLIDYVPGASSFTMKDPQKLSDKQRSALEFIRKNVLDVWGSTGVQHCLDAAVFELLRYFYVFPGGLNNLKDQYGRTLPDCFLMPPGTTALGFAFQIHSDLGNKFIRAIDVKKRLVVGKDHVLHAGDVIEIVSGK